MWKSFIAIIAIIVSIMVSMIVSKANRMVDAADQAVVEIAQIKVQMADIAKNQWTISNQERWARELERRNSWANIPSVTDGMTR